MESQLGKPPILPIAAKLYLQIVYDCYYKQGCYNTLVLPATIDKDATTPYLPATTGRKIKRAKFINCY